MPLRILIVARHFPPHVSGGARRPYGFATGLIAQGHRVFVCAPGLPESIPGAIVAHSNPDPPEGQSRFELPGTAFARELLLWPDPDIRWSRRAAEIALAACPFVPDWIFTTSPPESLLAAGAFLKRRTGARWVHDLRDNWLVRPFRRQRETAWRAAGERMLARHWLGQCDGAIAVNKEIASEVRTYSADLPVEIIEHFLPRSDEEISLPDNQTHIVHTGSFSLSDPGTRIADLLDVFREAALHRSDLHLHLVGRLSPDERRLAESDLARTQISLHGVRTLGEARAFQRAADGLVLVGAPQTLHPPGKTTEYLSTGNPIIAIGSSSWADQFNAGVSPCKRMQTLRRGETVARQEAMTDEAAALRLTTFLDSLQAAH